MNRITIRHNLDPTKPVQVYRNLNNNVWSVRQNGLVCWHCTSIWLKDVEYKVGKNGRQRVLKEGRKNVHAYVVGLITFPHLIQYGGRLDDGNICYDAFSVSYNPYKHDYFYNIETGEPVYKSRYCDMNIEISSPDQVLAIL